MSEFRLANKKAAKSNSSSQALTQQTHQSDQQVRIHHDVNKDFSFFFLVLFHSISKTVFVALRHNNNNNNNNNNSTLLHLINYPHLTRCNHFSHK